MSLEQDGHNAHDAVSSTLHGNVEEMQSGNLQVQEPHFVESMRSGTLQMQLENMQSGGLQFHESEHRAPYQSDEKSSPTQVQVEKVDPPVPIASRTKPFQRIHGLSRRTAWLVAVVLVLIVIGAVVGGAVAGTKSHETDTSTAPAAVSTTSTASVLPAISSTADSSSMSSMTTTNSATGPTVQPSPSPTFSANSWYRLTNLFLGPTISLDVVNDNGTSSSGTLKMAATGDYSGQYWQIKLSSTGNTYSLCTNFLGPNMRLDVTSNNPTTPYLAPTSGDAGQIWTISTWGDGTWYLTNQFTGSGLHLDTYSDTYVPFMGDGDHTGQHWNISEIEAISDVSFRD
jgi:hypothetical protein